MQKEILEIWKSKQNQNFDNFLIEPEKYNPSKVVFPDYMLNLDSQIRNKKYKDQEGIYSS